MWNLPFLKPRQTLETQPQPTQLPPDDPHIISTITPPRKQVLAQIIDLQEAVDDFETHDDTETN